MNIFSFHLSDPEDVQALIPKIKNLAGNYFDPDLDHLDYIWGTTAADTVYNVIIRMINKDENLWITETGNNNHQRREASTVEIPLYDIGYL